MLLSGIYSIVNKINSKCYIGSSSNLQYRWYHHKYNLERNKHHSSILQRAWLKYGAESFEFKVLEYIPMGELELLPYIEETYLNSVACDYNICKYTTKTRLGLSNSLQHKANISRSTIGRKLTPEHIQKSINTRKLNNGYTWSEERKNNFRNILKTKPKRKGRTFTLEQKEFMRNLKLGKPFPASAKKILSEKYKGRKLSSQTKERMSKARLKVFIVFSPKEEEFLVYNLKEFCSKHKLSYKAMINVSRGIKRTHRGGWRCLRKPLNPQ